LNPVVFRAFFNSRFLLYATCSFITITSPFLGNYELLDVIGNGSFGIIRKVWRKTDGLVYAIDGAFVFPGSPLFLVDIRTQGTQL
jgi:hypothetical protein